MKSKNTMKYITSLVLVLVLGLGMASTVFAASTISEATAKEIAYSDAGVSASQVKIDTLVFYRDGKDSYAYKFVFHTSSNKYVYTINAYSGAIKASHAYSINSSSNSNSSGSDNSEVVFYYDDALSIAMDNAGVTYTSIKEQEVQLKYKDKKNYYYYDVEIETVSGIEYEYEIGATTGEILTSKTSGKSKGATDTSYLGTDEAMAIAQSNSGISTSDIIKQEVELTTSKKVYVYEVEFKTEVGTKAEYTINASTGSIISSKVK